MDRLLDELKTYVMEHPLNFSSRSTQTLMDTLYYLYTELHAVDTPKMKACFLKAEAVTQHLTFQESDAICSLMVMLCSEQERAAFQAGIRIGAQLMVETFEK